jgi:cathepsin L
VDWRTQGVVTPVKDQGQCGGCWTFSTAETLESHIAIKTGKLMTFSEQALIDCVPNPDQCGGTGGCSGATQELAFNWTITAGITTEASYPYTAQTGTCDMAKVKPVATITGYAELQPNNYTALMNAVVSLGPIAISAAAEPWQTYETGVFHTSCGADVDHAIVLEGYGHDAASNLDYWLVRNSWSDSWGEKGYIRIARYGSTSKGEPCLEDKTPGDGDGCKGGPAKIQVCGLCGILSDSSYPIGGALA